MLLAMTVSISIARRDAMIPFIAVIIGSLLVMQLRRSVKGVIADERDYDIAGKSALLAMQIFSWIGAMTMLLLFAQRGTNPMIEPVAYTLSYSICLLMMLYAVIAKAYQKPIKANPHFWFSLVIGIVVVFGFIVMGLRLFSGEDNWVCKDGQWIEHGHPSFPMPTEACK